MILSGLFSQFHQTVSYRIIWFYFVSRNTKWPIYFSKWRNSFHFHFAKFHKTKFHWKPYVERLYLPSLPEFPPNPYWHERGIRGHGPRRRTFAPSSGTLPLSVTRTTVPPPGSLAPGLPWGFSPAQGMRPFKSLSAFLLAQSSEVSFFSSLFCFKI
jgi:hypothetical protein